MKIQYTRVISTSTTPQGSTPSRWLKRLFQCLCGTILVYIVAFCALFDYISGPLLDHSQSKPFDFIYEFQANHPPRTERFPSVEQRVKLYMGPWYTHENHTLSWQYHGGSSMVEIWNESNPEDQRVTLISSTSVKSQGQPFFLQAAPMQRCASIWNGLAGFLKRAVGKGTDFKTYCEGVVDLAKETSRERPPILFSFGDAHSQVTWFPMLGKWRNRHFTQKDPILWTLAERRHFGLIPSLPKVDIKWNQKHPGAVWRGELTGKQESSHRLSQTTATDLEKCRDNRRCRFVLDHVDELDVRLTGLGNHYLRSKHVGGKTILGLPLTRHQMLQNQILFSLEGNDVSSGLKWMLMSNSVVLLEDTRRTSWAMEEWLEPFVHYVPINTTNVMQQVEWVRQHPLEAEKIAQRATLFMWDMLYHPNAQQEEQEIQARIIERYNALWKTKAG
ncbi:MAG: glycosyl transferase family 90 [Myxococcota bacterium]